MKQGSWGAMLLTPILHIYMYIRPSACRHAALLIHSTHGWLTCMCNVHTSLRILYRPPISSHTILTSVKYSIITFPNMYCTFELESLLGPERLHVLTRASTQIRWFDISETYGIEYNCYNPTIGVNIVTIEGAASVEAGGATHPLQLPSKYRSWPHSHFPSYAGQDADQGPSSLWSEPSALVRTFSLKQIKRIWNEARKLGDNAPNTHLTYLYVHTSGPQHADMRALLIHSTYGWFTCMCIPRSEYCTGLPYHPTPFSPLSSTVSLLFPTCTFELERLSGP